MKHTAVFVVVLKTFFNITIQCMGLIRRLFVLLMKNVYIFITVFSFNVYIYFYVIYSFDGRAKF